MTDNAENATLEETPVKEEITEVETPVESEPLTVNSDIPNWEEVARETRKEAGKYRTKLRETRRQLEERNEKELNFEELETKYETERLNRVKLEALIDNGLPSSVLGNVTGENEEEITASIENLKALQIPQVSPINTAQSAKKVEPKRDMNKIIRQALGY